MNESRLRRSPVSGRWTIVVPGRRVRPHDGPAARNPCPFCAGNELLTPPEIEALRPGGGGPDTPGWTLRVVPNKFPVFAGGHEVIVHSPQHDLTLRDMEIERITDIVRAYQRRLESQCLAGAEAVTIIVNQGREAGASLEHPHSQVFATPLLPPLLRDEIANFDLHRTKYGGCLLCDMIATARSEGTRLVFDGPVAAWTPDAARWPFELWLAPAHHETDLREADASAVAGALKRALAALAHASGDAPVNLWIHSAPCRHDGVFHWHVEAAARLTTIAGFELATEIAINVIDPVDAAARLRAGLPAN